MHVRAADAKDGPVFLGLVQELADFERLAGPTPEARARLLEDAFGPHPRIRVLLAEENGQALGYAALFETYSTFRARPLLYLEDLYVTPSARRRGVARALLAACARDALARGCPALKWVVLDWNVEAQRFYEALGAREDTTWRGYGLEGDALTTLAGLIKEGL